jgi:hypothetical protein
MSYIITTTTGTDTPRPDLYIDHRRVVVANDMGGSFMSGLGSVHEFALLKAEVAALKKEIEAIKHELSKTLKAKEKEHRKITV